MLVKQEPRCKLHKHTLGVEEGNNGRELWGNIVGVSPEAWSPRLKLILLLKGEEKEASPLDPSCKNDC